MEEKLNEIENNTPIWLDRYFIEKSLRTYFGDTSIEVRSFSLKPVTAKGDNFASEMYRASVRYSISNKQIDRSISCIIKAAIESSTGLSLLNNCNVYTKESEMYQTILPQVRNLLKNAKIKSDIFPNTYYVNPRNNAIVLEDLAQKNYCMPCRLSGLDINHAKIVLNKLAKFHAGCAALKIQQPNIYKNFKNGMLNRSNDEFRNFYVQSFDALTNLVSQWSDYQYYAEKLKLLRPHLIENAKRSFDPKAHHFNTLIHGDIWLNNTMFGYTLDNIPEKMMIVDFQFCCWASPTLDLHYFFNTSLVEDLRLYYQDELVQYYYKVLTRALKNLQYPNHIPTLLEFNLQFMENSFYSFTSALLVQPIMIDDQVKDVDVDHLHGTGNRSKVYRDMIYSNAKVQQNIKNLLPIFDRKGLLDICY